MPTNHYECTRCKQPCEWRPATPAEAAMLEVRSDSPLVRTDVSKCCNAPMIIRSGKDW